MQPWTAAAAASADCSANLHTASLELDNYSPFFPARFYVVLSLAKRACRAAIAQVVIAVKLTSAAEGGGERDERGKDPVNKV